jgi:hypothetical protein
MVPLTRTLDGPTRTTAVRYRPGVLPLQDTAIAHHTIKKQ